MLRVRATVYMDIFIGFIMEILPWRVMIIKHTQKGILSSATTPAARLDSPKIPVFPVVLF